MKDDSALKNYRDPNPWLYMEYTKRLKQAIKSKNTKQAAIYISCLAAIHPTAYSIYLKKIKSKK